MSEFANSNAKIDDIVRNATNHEALREAIKRQMVADGTIARDKETLGYGVTRLRSDEPADASMPANGFEYEAIFRYHPESGRASIRVQAHTVQELQARMLDLEKTI